MSAAPAFPWPEFDVPSVETDFRSIFEHAPVPAARCDQRGIILQMNPAFEQLLNKEKIRNGMLCASHVVASQDREGTDRLFREVLEGLRSAVHIEGTSSNCGWKIWRIDRGSPESAQALLLADRCSDADFAEKDLLQAQRWEAVGRLTGGVVHDFNNLLTGVMLYCDLLLASLNTSERRLRRYAEEIRRAVAQAAMLVRQLLVFARSKSTVARPVSLNQVAETLRDLSTRLIGENVQLELNLDPRLGLVEIDWAQAEQVLLNLILNARDALPKGGRILVETRNCKFEPVKDAGAIVAAPVFPCVLLAVSDNGCGMDAVTRQRLFEPFYTTKATGSGLGLTTVRCIVTDYRGLIHVESEPGRGTRVMILLPQSSIFPHLATANSDSTLPTFREVKKEPHL
jgi:two-component system, cell cycle sensor histidine kinase and response regulator CckA